ncbi:MAG TPA: hypothetical protein VJJ80_01545 [Patescibacteria group bacterium]|nr:hypothetical protein [Patescibacteria group bacterium]
MNSPSWDLFIIIFLAIATGYGFILQKEKAAATLISTYIALAVTSVWGEAVYNILSGNTILFNQVWFQSHLSIFTVKAIMFGAFIVLLSLKGEYLSSRTGTVGSTILLFLYSFLNAGLIVATIISFMDEAARTNLLLQSQAAEMIFKYQNYWIALPAIILIVAGFRKKSNSQSEQ